MDLGQRELIDEHGAKSIEENLKGAEESFPSDRVKEDGFKGGR